MACLLKFLLLFCLASQPIILTIGQQEMDLLEEVDAGQEDKAAEALEKALGEIRSRMSLVDGAKHAGSMVHHLAPEPPPSPPRLFIMDTNGTSAPASVPEPLSAEEHVSVPEQHIPEESITDADPLRIDLPRPRAAAAVNFVTAGGSAEKQETPITTQITAASASEITTIIPEATASMMNVADQTEEQPFVGVDVDVLERSGPASATIEPDGEKRQEEMTTEKGESTVSSMVSERKPESETRQPTPESSSITEARQEVTTVTIEVRQDMITEERQETTTETHQDASAEKPFKETRQETTIKQEETTEMRQETTIDERQEATTGAHQDVTTEAPTTETREEATAETRQNATTEVPTTEMRQEAEVRQETTTEMHKDITTEVRQETTTTSPDQTHEPDSITVPSPLSTLSTEAESSVNELTTADASVMGDRPQDKVTTVENDTSTSTTTTVTVQNMEVDVDQQQPRTTPDEPEANGTLSINEDILQIELGGQPLDDHGLVRHRISVPFDSLDSLGQQPIPDLAITMLHQDPRPSGHMLLAKLELRPQNAIVDIRPHHLAPGDVAQLWLINPPANTDRSAEQMDFEIVASLMEWDGQQVVVEQPDAQPSLRLFWGHLSVEGHPKVAPQLAQSDYEFVVAENATDGTELGQLEVAEQLQHHQQPVEFELFGHGAQFFNVGSDGQLRLRCSSESCLDHEQTPVFYLVATASYENKGASSEPASVTIRVTDVNDRGPRLELLSGDEILVEDGMLRGGTPFVVAVTDQDSELENRFNTLSLAGNDFHLFQLGKYDGTEGLYHIGLMEERREDALPPLGNYTLQLVVEDGQGHRGERTVPVRITSTKPPPIAFTNALYERTMPVERIHTGAQILQLQLADTTNSLSPSMFQLNNFLFVEGNPGWLSLEPFGGNVFVGEVPKDGVKPGNYSMRAVAIDREQRTILAECMLRLVVLGPAQPVLRFPEPFVQMTIPRLDDYDEEGEEEGVEQNANLTNVEPSANIANLVPFPEAGEYLAHVQMVEDQVEAWDDAGRPAKLAKDSVLVDSVSTNGSIQLDLAKLRAVRAIHIPFIIKVSRQSFEQNASEADEERALVAVTLQSFPQQLAARQRRLSKPRFAVPWTNEAESIRLRIAEELPIGHPILHLPAYNPMNASDPVKIVLEPGPHTGLVALRDDGLLVVSGRLDFEQPAHRLLELRLVASSPSTSTTTVALVQLELLDLDDMAPELVAVVLRGNNNGGNLSASEQHPPVVELDLEEGVRDRGDEVLLEVELRDPDSGGRKHRCALIGAQGAERFMIRQSAEKRWSLSVAAGAELDYEEQAKFALLLRCTDAGGNSAEMPIRVRLSDKNDQRPLLSWAHQDDAVIRLAEGTPAGAPVTRFWARDRDAPGSANASVRFALAPGAPASEFFHIDPETGVLSLAKDSVPLNILGAHLGGEALELEVVAKDSGEPPLQSTARVRILIEDGTDDGSRELRMRKPALDDPPLRIPEDTPKGHQIVQAEAVWANGRKNGDKDTNDAEIRYRITNLDDEHQQLLRIDERTGAVFIEQELDYEQATQHTFVITAFSTNGNGTMAAEVSALLPVHVVNTDDHLPYFPHSLKTHSAELTLSLPTGEFNRSSSTDMEQRRSLGHVQAVDEDSAPFNRGFYSIVPKCSNPHPDQSHVSVDKDTGELFIASVDGQIWPEADQAIRICVLISSSELDLAELARLSRHDLAAHPESLLHLQILPEPPRIRPIPARLIRANNSRQLLSRQLIDQRVTVAEDEEAAEGVGSGFKMALDSLEFVAYGQTKAQRVGALQALRPLVAISPADARLRFDPAIRDALTEDGMYRFGISLTDKGTSEAVDTVFKNVHLLGDSHRLRFVFNESIHTIGANLTKFIGELESTLSNRIANSEPARDPAKQNRRTSMCFHLWSPDSGAIVVLDEAARAISTHVPELQQHNQPLAELYIRFGVINIEPCELDSAGPVLNSSPVLHAESKQYLAAAIAACTLALVLFACGTYACCVRRMQRKRGMLLQEEQRSASDNPYSIYPSAAGNVHNNTTSNSVFSVPEFIQTKQILGEGLDY